MAINWYILSLGIFCVIFPIIAVIYYIIFNRRKYKFAKDEYIIHSSYCYAPKRTSGINIMFRNDLPHRLVLTNKALYLYMTKYIPIGKVYIKNIINFNRSGKKVLFPYMQYYHNCLFVRYIENGIQKESIIGMWKKSKDEFANFLLSVGVKEIKKKTKKIRLKSYKNLNISSKYIF